MTVQFIETAKLTFSYELEGSKAQKNRPWWYFQPTQDETLLLGGFAGLQGFTILTRTSVESVATVHDRTPVIGPSDRVQDWINPERSGKDALALAPVKFGAALDAWRVSDDASRLVEAFESRDCRLRDASFALPAIRPPR